MGLKRWDTLLKRIPEDRLVVGAEIGVWEGDLSFRILGARPMLTLHMVDRWAAPPEGQTVERHGIKVSGPLADSEMNTALKIVIGKTRDMGARAILHRGESVEVAMEFADASLDFAFIDADHSFEGVLADLLAWGPKVRPGGYLCGHDWGRWGVNEAVGRYWIRGGWENGEWSLPDHTWFMRRIG